MDNLSTFLLIGQSNMAGRGEIDTVKPIEDKRILMYRNSGWLPAREPLHQDRSEAGIGLAMSFAHMLLKNNMAERIGLIPCAVGATSIAEWLPGTGLYERAVSTALQAAKTLQGVLWHQGEYDSISSDQTAVYGYHLKKLILELRIEFKQPKLPFISGELGEFINADRGFPFARDISGILKSLANEIPRYACVSAMGLQDKGDGLHFGAPSLRELGRRYAAAYILLETK